MLPINPVLHINPVLPINPVLHINRVPPNNPVSPIDQKEIFGASSVR